MTPLLIGVPGWQELMIILVILLLLFGNRLPTMMRSLGRGVNEFKRGLKDSGDDADDSLPPGEKKP